MYHSNQILVVTGDNNESLLEAIKFALKYDSKNISDMVGMSSINGALYFGWIPYKTINSNKEYEKEYMSKWQTTFTDKLLPMTDVLIVEVICNWLKSEEIEKLYEKMYNDQKCGYWDTPCHGWKLTGFDCFNEQNSPTFGVIKIEPYWTEYEE